MKAKLIFGLPQVEVREEAARGLIKPKVMRAPESLLPDENAALIAEKEAQAYPTFVEMIAYLSTPVVTAARSRMSAAVQAAMVSFCGDCLATSAKDEGELTRAAYLTPERTEAAQRYACPFVFFLFVWLTTLRFDSPPQADDAHGLASG